MRSRIRPFLLAFLLVIPVVIGMIWSASAPSPAETQSSEQAEGQPITTAAQSSQELVDTRRAAGEATTQAGFLVTGTNELADGSGKLNDATTQLSDGAKQAADASQQLASGMTELQAATGQLGDGATKVADGVQLAVEQIQGLAAMQGQLLAFIDEADKQLGKYPMQDAKDMRVKLGELRTQLNGIKFDGETADQLNQLRSGSRELADQLSKPGGAFHDGVFTATDASKRLSTGLVELRDGATQINGATGELKEGADRIKGMADQNKTKVQAVQQTLPTGVAAAGTPDMGQEQSQSTVRGLGSVGLVIGIFVMMAASALWLVARPNSGLWTPVLAVGTIAAIGAILLLAFGSTGKMLVAQSGVIVLTAIAGAFLGRAMLALFGEKIGRGVLLATMLLQTAVVAATFGTEKVFIAAFPLYYSMRGLLAAAVPELLMSSLVLVLLSAAGYGVIRLMERGQDLEFAEEEEYYDEELESVAAAAT